MENNFKKYERQLIEQNKVDLEGIQNNLTQTKSSLGFIGEMLELFLPKVFDLLITLGGGTKKKNQDKYPHEEK